MDTHVTAHFELPETEPALTARLPNDLHEEQDEGSPAAKESGSGSGTSGPDDRLPSSLPAKRRKRRTVLLTGVAAAALVVAGGAFLVSPYNAVYPVPRMASAMRDAAAQAGINFPAPLAPAASLASVALPPPAAPVVREKYENRPRGAQLDELLALHAADGRKQASAPYWTPAPASSTAPAASRLDGPPPGYVPSEPGGVGGTVVAEPPAPSARATSAQQRVSSPTGGPDVTSAIIASLDHPVATPQPGPSSPAPVTTPSTASTTPGISTPAATSPVSEPAAPTAAGAATLTPTAAIAPPAAPSATAAPAPQPGEPDMARVARDLRAAPMSGPEQVQVLGLVTQMAAMVRDLKGQNAQLRSDFAKTVADTDLRLVDFERRLELAEARRAVAAAEDAGAPPAPVVTAPVAGMPATGTKAISITVTTGVQALPPTSEPVKAYRVQAASPGLAMLAQIDRGGGDGAQIQVQVGDTLPGYGKVKSVTQRGVNWVVNTERGVIGQ